MLEIIVLVASAILLVLTIKTSWIRSKNYEKKTFEDKILNVLIGDSIYIYSDKEISKLMEYVESFLAGEFKDD